MNNLKEKLDEAVRDLTAKHPLTKSEARGIVLAALNAQQEEIDKILIDELATAHTEGQPTSRLTSAYNRIAALTPLKE